MPKLLLYRYEKAPDESGAVWGSAGGVSFRQRHLQRKTLATAKPPVTCSQVIAPSWGSETWLDYGVLSSVAWRLLSSRPGDLPSLVAFHTTCSHSPHDPLLT